MSITTRSVEHTLEDQTFDSLFVCDDVKQGARPTVLVFHDWAGRSEDQESFAKRLSAWGYAALAVDLYGKGKRGKTTEECQALMAPLAQDRALLRKRLLHVVSVAQGVPEIDKANIAAIGFCFGGLCGLDLARAGGQVKGVASFHGVLAPSGLPDTHPIRAKIIAFHGWDDPFGPPTQVLAFANELTEGGADWQLHAFGATKHSFMNEGANRPDMGLVYSALAADRAWKQLRLFLADVFTA